MRRSSLAVCGRTLLKLSGTLLTLLMIATIVSTGPVVTLASVGHFALMPMPASLLPGDGKLILTPDFKVALTGYREPRLERALLRMIERLRAQTGLPLHRRLSADPDAATMVVQCLSAGAEVLLMVVPPIRDLAEGCQCW